MVKSSAQAAAVHRTRLWRTLGRFMRPIHNFFWPEVDKIGRYHVATIRIAHCANHPCSLNSFDARWKLGCIKGT